MTGPAEVRRWIRRHRIAANGRVDPGTVYAVGLALVMAFALFGRPVVALIWPASAPPVGPVPALPAAAVALVFAAFFWVLRQIGPLSVSRSDAT